MDSATIRSELKSLGQGWIEAVKPDPADADLLADILVRMAELGAEHALGTDRTDPLRTCEQALATLRAKYEVRVGMANEDAAEAIWDKALTHGTKILFAALL